MPQQNKAYKVHSIPPRLRKAISEVGLAGTFLSNVVFNLSQGLDASTIVAKQKATLQADVNRWDAACDRLRELLPEED
jgi:hypothetical protein